MPPSPYRHIILTAAPLLTFVWLLSLSSALRADSQLNTRSNTDLTQTETSASHNFSGHVQPYQTPRNRFEPPAVTFFAEQKPLQLSDYKGQVLIVNFWASWCPTCLSELPSLQRLQHQLQRAGSNAQVLTLNQDLNNHQQIFEVLSRYQAAQLPSHRDLNGRLGFALGQTLLPTTILIDSNGYIAGQLIGSADWDSPQAMALIASLEK
ncbi:MAG: TlpA disulfide reductase family protein [Motiliproteus sp.]